LPKWAEELFSMLGNWNGDLLRKFKEEMLLKIVQVLNNNVAVVNGHDGKPAIVMGNGLAFGKKEGDVVEKENVVSTFMLRDKHTVEDLTTLLEDVPADFVAVSYSLIEQSQKKYNFAVESYLYITLTLHLYSAYQRLEEGRYRANYSLPDLSDKYPEAYKIADDFLTGFRERLRVDFPLSERNSIALHVINAHGDRVSQAAPIDSLDDQLVNIINDILRKNGIVRNNDNLDDYGRLLTHVKYFARRLRKDRQEQEVQISASSLASIGNDFPEAEQILNKIAGRIDYELGVKIPKLERLYLVIHIARLLDRKKQK
jgi:transcriptional antiterminator